MRELKILIVLVFFTGVMYWGIEPYAHHVFNPAVKEADYTFRDLQPTANSDATVAQERLRIVQGIDAGDIDAGRTAVETNCAACHTIHSAEIAFMDEAGQILANGLLPTDLSNASAIYDEVFLAHFITNPPNAAFMSNHTIYQKDILAEAKAQGGDNEHLNSIYLKSVNGFNDKMQSSYIKMPGYEWLGEAEIANILAFLRTQAKPIDQLTNKEVAIGACARCHSIDYDKVPLAADPAALESYLGALPPDLSMMVKSKGDAYLHTFINDPQKHLLGTAMPRVGLNKEAQEKVIAYLDEVGDPVKAERNGLGLYFVAYFLILSLLAYLWKHNEFKEIGK